jgi:hypothetical protein
LFSIGRIESATHSTDPLKFVNDFMEANADAITSRQKNIADSDTDSKSIEDSLNGFTESSKVLIKGLTALGHLHPFIGSTHSIFYVKTHLTLGTF